MIRDLSVKSDSPPTECQVRVEIKDGDDWVRIPVTSCELWIDKDGPSSLQRTAKVKFPGEWGGQDVLQYINGFTTVGVVRDPDLPAPEDTVGTFEGEFVEFDEARIYFQDEDTGVYQIAHYGYVGGIGPAAENGVFKLWVYDPADLMRRIRVSKAFGRPTIQQVVDFVLRGEDDTDNPVGLESRSVFDDIGVYIAGVQEVKQAKQIEERREREVVEDIGDGFQFIADVSLPFVGQYQLPLDDVVADIFDWAKDNLIDPQLTGQRRFQLNRHNMADLMNWFAAEVGGKWHFEPSETGPVLFFDNTASRGATETLTGSEQREDGEITRRHFIDREIEDATEMGTISDFTDRDAFDLITTLDNQALYDIKPFNSLTLFGETHDHSKYNRVGPGPVIGQQQRRALHEAPSAAPIRSSQFPKVEVEYPPLVDRAGGYKYEAPAVESDKVSLKQAKQHAIDEFRQYLQEETEGSITIVGNPYIAPYDYVTSIPVCDGIYRNVDAPGMTYEVNSVKHTRSAEERYKTRLGVSLVFDETKLNVNARYVEA